MISINSRRKRFLSAYTIKLTSYASHDALRGGNSCCERADPNNKIHKNNCDILLLWSTNSKMIDEDKLLGWWMLWDISKSCLGPYGHMKASELPHSDRSGVTAPHFPVPGVFVSCVQSATCLCVSGLSEAVLENYVKTLQHFKFDLCIY